MEHDVLTLARIARLLERTCTELEPPLTLAQYRLLAMVARGTDRASELAGRLALTKPSVSATVDALAERGLVTRTIVDDDRRALRLQITDDGRTALHVAETAMRELIDDVVDRVDDPDAVREALAQLHAALDERRAERRSR